MGINFEEGNSAKLPAFETVPDAEECAAQKKIMNIVFRPNCMKNIFPKKF